MSTKMIDARIRLKWLALAFGLSLCSMSASIAHASGDASRPAKRAVNNGAQAGARADVRLKQKNVAKIKVGCSTDVDVKSLLGEPWRTTNYGEAHCGCYHHDMQEVWEYRGLDSSGSYTLHIEFDDDRLAQIVAKIPDRSGVAARGGKNPGFKPGAAQKRALRAER